MCGITGIIGQADREIIEHMTTAIAHRGPDDQGIYRDEAGQVALGHRRLSIIDLSAAGHQPMSYAKGRYWIVYNGEIYNFATLRTELEQLGHRFHSETDTEVVLAAYAEWGTSCLERIRGMFAFAIYDRGPETDSINLPHPDLTHMFLARDRFGIKPLYYTQNTGGVTLFASELKALLASGLISRQIDYQAIWDYLSLGSVPQPRTILADVRTLPPGHAMTIKSHGQVKVWRYWDIATQSRQNFPNAQTMGLTEAASELRRLLNEATQLHMIADVPVGAFLSGGIDSTAAVGLMSQYVSQPVKTYSIGFESQHSHLSELKWAKIVSERFNTDHTEVIVSGNDVSAMYDRLVYAIDQPSIDGTNTFFVSQAARTGVTVSLSGLGGDELFAGYPQFWRFKSYDIGITTRLLLSKFSNSMLSKIAPKQVQSRIGFLAATTSERLAMIRSLAHEQAKRSLTTRSFQEQCHCQPLAAFYRSMIKPDLDIISQVSYVELNGYMANTLLRDADAMSMSYALEVRPIFLDHVLAEFAFALPPELKLQGKKAKVVFIEALRDLLPEPIIHRSKMGFEMPLRHWLGGPLKERAKTTLDSYYAKAIFCADFLNRANAIFDLPRPQPGETRLWAYVLLLEWLQLHSCII